MTSRETTDQHSDEHEPHSPEGRRFELDDQNRTRVIELAFDYRGDITLGLDDGSSVEGYLFDRRQDDATGAMSIRLIEQATGQRRSVSIDRITTIAFTGRDTAAGKSWETWVRRYTEKMNLDQ